MNSVIDALGSFTHTIVSIIAAPLNSLSPVWALSIISIIIGIFFLFVYGMVSNQTRLRSVKKKIGAAFLEAILFRHDFVASLRAQGSMALNGCVYFLLAVPPLLILLIPSLFLLAQLNDRFGYRPFRIGEAGILGLHVSDESQLYRISIKSAPEGLDITPPIRIKESNEVLWRVTPRTAGDKALVVSLGDSGKELAAKIHIAASGVAANDKPEPISARAETKWWWKLFYPGSSLKDYAALVDEQWLTYPEQPMRFLGMTTHWLIVFAVVSIGAGIIASRVFKIEI